MQCLSGCLLRDGLIVPEYLAVVKVEGSSIKMSETSSIRKSDSPFHDPVQTCRFVTIDGNWFFMTRENGVRGPYATRAGAETALDIYLQEEISGSTNNLPITNSQYQVDDLADNNILLWGRK